MSKLTITYERGVKKQFIDGVEATQAQVDKVFPPKPFEAPMATMAWDTSTGGLLGKISSRVPRNQVASMREFLKSRKVQGVDVRDDGVPVFRTRGARNDYMAARGMVDFDGGFGDRTRD